MPRLLSIDPGKRTGIAWGYYDHKTPYTLHRVETVDQDQFYEMQWDYDILGESGTMHTVVETFVLSSGNQFVADLTGVELIGFIKGVHPNRSHLHWQSRTDKALCSDAVLKSSGLWRTGKTAGWNTDGTPTGRHTNDALIHALVWLKRQSHAPTIQHYWPETLED